MQLIEERLRSLMLLSLAGDAVAYRMFLDELTAHLRSYLRRRLGGLPDEVEDLLQELLLAVHNKRHTYDPKPPLTAWVQAIARYKLVDLNVVTPDGRFVYVSNAGSGSISGFAIGSGGTLTPLA